MDRRTAMTSIAAMALAGCAGDAVLAQGGASVPTEAEIWANPTAHGVMPLEYIRNELMRLTACSILRREQMRTIYEGGFWLYAEDVNGLATALRLMGVCDNIDVAWANDVIAALGQPMSERTDTPWLMWPGNSAWRAPQFASLGYGNAFSASISG